MIIDYDIERITFELSTSNYKKGGIIMKEFAEIIEKKIKEFYNSDRIYIKIQSITNDKLLIQFEINQDLVEFDFDYDIGLSLDENIFILQYEIDGNLCKYYKK